MKKKEYTLEDKIRSNNVAIVGNALLATVSAVAVVYGGYGVVRITKNVINCYHAGCSFNMSTDNNDLYGIVYGSTLFFGFTGFYSRGAALRKNLQYKKSLTRRIDNQTASDGENY